MKQQNKQTHLFDSYKETKWHYLRGGMLVPAPPEVDARQTSGFTVKHDQTSIWKTIRSETKLYLHKPRFDYLRSPSRRKPREEGVFGSCPGQRDSKGSCVECRNTMLYTDIKAYKESSGQRPRLSPLPRAAKDQTIASHRERCREKQIGPACSRVCLEPTLRRAAHHDKIMKKKCKTTGKSSKFEAYL